LPLIISNQRIAHSLNQRHGFGPFKSNGNFKLASRDGGAVATRWRLVIGQKGGGLA